ncbi:segregation protein SMC [Gemella bergeri ATCC 700627]|uniref:Chromosome partition protein Smc n=1 Tax=Gemella bergeri ATCC 700627 TaxID=1321820 RepID=U2QRM8_9BACL|nr:chromosome segregation protein SMC [Gemella bergeri]ERK58869.1 segregation protein SMC [Gemella bergeri ATCC 700627]
MKLSQVEITGFKSFQGKTTFKFDNNLIGVVGPNGSGKSNIIDAIRWVLGEQSAKNLRGSSMKDVIFSGTEQAKKKNFAEVSLTFSNEQSNKEIKRRLYRNGDSEYFIDNKRAKLKDISDLYLDFGINKESYSIITQGKVEDIISSKPIDRRAIIEEASGVLKYKNKKKETNTKLEKTTDNINRLNDIFSEIKERYTTLEEQKNKTENYLAYTKELEKKDILINIYNIDECNKKLTQILNEKAGVQKEKEIFEKKQNELIKNLEYTKNSLMYLDKTYLKYHNEELELVQKRESIQSELKVIEERKNNRNIRTEKLEQDEEYLRTRKKNFEIKLKERKLSESELLKKVKKLSLEISNLENKDNNTLDIITQNIENIKDKYYSLTIEETKLENSIETAKRDFESSDENYKNLVIEIETLEKSYKEKNHNLSALIDDLGSINNKLKEHGEITSKLLSKNIQYLEEEKEFDEQLKTGYNFQSNLMNRKKFLEDQINNLSFYNIGVKEILSSKDTISGIHNSVANIMSFDNKYAIALDMALGYSQQNIVVENENVAKKCIEQLKKTNKGRVTFLPLNNIKSKVINKDIYKILVNEEGFINIAEELVKVDDRYKNIISYLLGLVIIVDNIDNANRIARKISFKNRIITLDGQVINSGGSITGGAINKNSNSLIKTNSELEELENNLIKINSKIETLTIKYESIVNLNREIVVKIDNEKQKKSDLNLKQKEIELKIEHLKNELIPLNTNIEINKKKLLRYKNTDSEFENISLLVRKLEETRRTLKELSVELEKEKLKRENVELEENEYLEKIAELKIEKSKIEETLKHSNETIENLTADIVDIDVQLKKLEISKETEMLSVEEEKKIFENNSKLIIECNDKLDMIKGLLTDLNFEKSDLFKKEKEITQEQQVNNKDLKKKMLHFEQLTISQTKIEVKIDEFLENLIYNYNVTYESVKDKLGEEDRLNIHIYKNEVGNLKKNILNLGNVNMNAIVEFEEIKERYDFYSEQITDLVDAKGKLEQTITEIDKEVKERFLGTFVQVAENFNKIFKELFKGGYADMSLETPNDILNTGIIIEASPPGKKLQNLSLLSGGEKSLTAISLLFAILKVKNPPFVVLDEVEAALDEENVNRFSKFLKIYSTDNQFLVITHRRGTMEVMDKLYGVTMKEKGISYILELELKDIVEKGEYN